MLFSLRDDGRVCSISRGAGEWLSCIQSSCIIRHTPICSDHMCRLHIWSSYLHYGYKDVHDSQNKAEAVKPSVKFNTAQPCFHGKPQRKSPLCLFFLQCMGFISFQSVLECICVIFPPYPFSSSYTPNNLTAYIIMPPQALRNTSCPTVEEQNEPRSTSKHPPSSSSTAQAPSPNNTTSHPPPPSSRATQYSNPSNQPPTSTSTCRRRGN